MTTRLRRAALTVLAVVAAVLAIGVGTASAHVSVSSPDAAPGGFGELTFRVPSESDTAKTTSLRVQLPTDTPFAFVSVKPVPGWTAETTTTTLDTPVEAEGTTITEAVTEVTWTADPGGGLEPGQYQTFSISAGPLPDARLGDVPGPAGLRRRLDRVVDRPDRRGPGRAGAPCPHAEPRAPPSGDTAADSSGTSSASSADTGSSGLAVTALIVGIVGLLVGAVGVVLALGARRRAAAPVAPAAAERDPAGV